MFIKISSNHYLDAKRVIAVFPAHSRPAINLRNAAKKEGRLINMKGGTVKIKSMCVMDTGQVALLPLTSEAFVDRVALAEGVVKEIPIRRGGRVYQEEDVMKDDLELEKVSAIHFPKLGGGICK